LVTSRHASFVHDILLIYAGPEYRPCHGLMRVKAHRPEAPPQRPGCKGVQGSAHRAHRAHLAVECLENLMAQSTSQSQLPYKLPRKQTGMPLQQASVHAACGTPQGRLSMPASQALVVSLTRVLRLVFPAVSLLDACLPTFRGVALEEGRRCRGPVHTRADRKSCVTRQWAGH